MNGRAAALALAALLAGCTLHSPMPLIDVSERPEAAVPGAYRIYSAMDRKQRGKLPRAYRAACLDPGYFGEQQSAAGKSRGRRVRVYYCG